MNIFFNSYSYSLEKPRLLLLLIPLPNLGFNIELTYSIIVIKRFFNYLAAVPRLIFSSSSGNFLNFTYTFVCNVEGILVPTVTWKLTGSLINSKLREIKTGKGYPFVIDNEYTGIGVVSTLTIHTVGYCFGGNTVSCWANNNVQKDKMMEQFSIEPGIYCVNMKIY